MASIREVSTGSGARSVTELRNLAVAEFISSWPLAPYAEFYTFTGNADAPRQDYGEFNAGDTRTTSTDYTPKEKAPQFASVSLKIYGDKVQTDIAYERRGGDIGSQRVTDLRRFAQSLGRYFMDATINHDNALDSKQITGLKAQAAALSRVVPWGTNGTVLEASTLKSFLELLDEQILSIPGGPTCIIANGKFISRLTNLARDYVRVEAAPDVFGRQQLVTVYNEIPIVNAGFKANRTGLVIGNNETVGTSNDCTSIYLVRFGEQQDVTFATNVGLDVQDLGLVGTKYVTLVEFDVDLVVLNPNALVRIEGIRF